MRHVVILGGGFAGVAAAKELIKSKLEDTKITLIDKNSYHLFTPSLYEVATSEEPKKNITIPFKEIFGRKVHIIVGEVIKIDAGSQNVVIASKAKQSQEIPRDDPESGQTQTIPFDYLIITLGSESAYMGIPGLKEYAMSLKTIDDAIAIKNKIKDMCCAAPTESEQVPLGRREEKCNRKVQVVIGGGGFSGTELAAELLMYKDRLAKQNHLATDCLEISIIQGADKLLKELDTHVSDIAQKRIAGPQIKFCFGGHITKVTKENVLTDNGKSYPYDICIWTGGVGVNHIVKSSDLPVSPHGQLLVNEFLQVLDHPNILASGDDCEFVDPKTKKPAPGVAQVAEEEGKVAGENVARLLKQEELLPYRYRHFGYIVPLRGRFAAVEFGKFHIDGFLGWVLQQLVFFRYLWGILSPWKAMKRWNTFEGELRQ